MQHITVETIIEADINKVWEHWNNTDSITGWAFASADWKCPYAENDLRAGGKFLTRMAAKDGSESFDFTGTYTEVVEPTTIKYLMDKADGDATHRDCTVTFSDLGDGTTKVTEEFYPETVNSVELQKAGWQAILDNFKAFVGNN